MAAGVGCDSGYEEPFAVLGTVEWVGDDVVIKCERVTRVEKTDLSVDQSLVRAGTVVFRREQCPEDGPPLEQETLSGVDGGLRVCGDICFIHEFAGGFCVSSLVAVVVDVDVEPV